MKERITNILVMNIKAQLKGEVLKNDFLLFRDRLEEYRRPSR